MADSIDSLQKQVDKLSRILRAQQGGIPDRLVVMVTGRNAKSPEGVRKAITDRLAAYGLDDESDAAQAGCEVIVLVLPWLESREAGHHASVIEDRLDASKTASDSVQISVKPLKAFTGNNSFSLGTEEGGKRDDLS